MSPEPNPASAGSTVRFYLVVGAMMGLIVGFLLLDRFAIQGATLRFVLLLLVAITGGLTGVLLLRLQEPTDEPAPDRDPPRMPDDPADDDEDLERVEEDTREGGTSRMRFFAVASDRRSSSDLRTVRIRPHRAPFAPPACQLRLMIEQYDASARVPVAEGVLEKLPVAELLQRVRVEARARCPRNADDVQFRLVAYRAEGPLGPDGRCTDGWTFSFVDGEIGLACLAITTRHEISLHYQTTASYWRPVDDAPIDPAQAMETLFDELPDWRDREVWGRFNLPGECLLYLRDPLVIADVDVAAGSVRNKSALERAAQARERTAFPMERFELEDLEAFLRGEGDAESPAFREAVRDQAFANGLRTLQPESLRRFASGLQLKGLPERLAERIRAAEDTEDRRMLLFLMAHVPSGLTPAILQRVAATDRDPAIKALAETLASERRDGLRTTPADPLDTLDFAQSREAMGKGDVRAVPLRSVYEVEDELLAPLAELGLLVRRRQLLSGSQPLLLGVSLRPARGDTEALIASNPLPMPCHVLHVVGGASEAFIDRVEAAGLVYHDEEMRRDALSDRLHDVFRAALYLAAMKRPAPEDGRALVAAFARSRADRNLRRAVLLGLEHTPAPTVTAFLERIRDEDEGAAAEIAAAVLGRRRTRQGGAFVTGGFASVARSEEPGTPDAS